MGFNKRFFSMEMLSIFYNRNPETGIGECIGKTEGFVYEDSGSSQVINLWRTGKKEAAKKIMEEYVSRIATQVSSNS